MSKPYRATFSNGSFDFAPGTDVYGAARKILIRAKNLNKTINEMHVNEGTYNNPKWVSISFSREKIFTKKKESL